jgi:hypothetical protein
MAKSKLEGPGNFAAPPATRLNTLRNLNTFLAANSPLSYSNGMNPASPSLVHLEILQLQPSPPYDWLILASRRVGS